jgi:pimeloyl-ACP methyl ester carboxylesterase
VRPGTVDLPDGRRLGYAEYGDPAGPAVVFVPGAGCGRLMRVDAPRLRLVVVDRPGLGASTPHPDKTLHSVGADIAELVGALGCGPVPVVANSQGAPFGLAAAAAGAASAVVLVSPIDDLAHPPVAAQLPAAYRAMLDAVAADPDGAQADFAAFTADRLFAMVMDDYPASDAGVYERPGFRAMFAAALADGFASGSAGYARDTVLAMTAWPADLFATDVPVTVLFGADDTVHSPDRAATLTARLRGATRDVVPGVGGALLWARPDLVADCCSG